MLLVLRFIVAYSCWHTTVACQREQYVYDLLMLVPEEQRHLITAHYYLSTSTLSIQRAYNSRTFSFEKKTFATVRSLKSCVVSEVQTRGREQHSQMHYFLPLFLPSHKFKFAQIFTNKKPSSRIDCPQAKMLERTPSSIDIDGQYGASFLVRNMLKIHRDTPR